MNPRHFLFIAEALIREVENAPDSIYDGAKCRTTYNRAYYAAFLVACELFDALDPRVPSGSKCHAAVKEGLNNSGSDRLIKISEQLGTLYAGRADADYKMRVPTTETIEKAKLNVQLAKHVINMIDAIRNPNSTPPLNYAAVKNTILKWAREAAQPISPK